MEIIGLTGGAGMGKSTASNWLKRRHIPVFDADKTVHALQRRGGAAVNAIEAAFPGVVRDGAVNRAVLREKVIGKPDALRVLEKILHPLVRHAEYEFIKRSRRHRKQLIVLDIPLLFETGGDRLAHRTITMTAPSSVQKYRLRLRGLNGAQIDKLIAHQMPDRRRRHLADDSVQTGLSRFHSVRQLTRILGKKRRIKRQFRGKSR